MKKRILSLLLAVLTVVSLLPAAVLDSFAYSHSASTPLPAGAYKSWKQTDPRWTNVPIGIYPWYDRDGGYHYYNTVGHAGCYISSIAILCNAYGLKFPDGSQINPGSFGERLYDNGKCTYLTSDGSMYYANTWCGTMIRGIEYVGRRWFTSESNATIAKTIAGYLNDPSGEYGVIVGVTNHYVAVDYVSGSSVYLCDPGYNRNELFTYYNGRIEQIIVYRFNSGSTPVKKTFTVSYNANGGVRAPASQTKTEGEALTLHAEPPSRVGYTFLGWSTSATGGVVYAPSASYTADADITLYAVWRERSDCEIRRVKSSNALNIRSEPSTSSGIITALPAGSEIAVTEIRIGGGHIWGKVEEGWCALEYTDYVRGALYSVSYNANGGSGAPGAQPSAYGQTLTLSSVKPTRENYEFLGWSLSATAADAAYAPGGAYVNQTATSVVLYAVWQKVGSTVSYDANGGKGAPAAQRKPFGESVKLSTRQPTRTGYDFAGWSTTKDGAVEFAPGAVYRADENLTLYAVWTVQTYTVRFDANGGSGAPQDMQKTYGTRITLPQVLLSKPDFLFLGWATEPDAQAAKYRAGDTYTAEGNATLYAVWKPYSYLVVFRANGGSNAPASAWKVKDVPFLIPAEKPTREDYVFLGWSTDPDAEIPEYSPGDELTVNGETVLFAVWGKGCYLIAYNANGGGNAPSDQIKQEGEALTLTDKIPDREGYSFLGWALTPDAAEPTYQPSSVWSEEREATLYAVWEPNDYTVTVRYIYEDGTAAAPSAMLTCAYGTEYSVDSPLLDMRIPTERTVSGTMEASDFTVTVVYFWAERYPRSVIVTGVSDMEETGFTVTGQLFEGDGTVEYGVSLTDSADGVLKWQTDPAFTDLAGETDYYVFVRVTGSTYYEDTVSDPVMMHTRNPANVTDEPDETTYNPIFSDPGDLSGYRLGASPALSPYLSAGLVLAGLALVLASLITFRRLQ